MSEGRVEAVVEWCRGSGCRVGAVYVGEPLMGLMLKVKRSNSPTVSGSGGRLGDGDGGQGSGGGEEAKGHGGEGGGLKRV